MCVRVYIFTYTHTHTRTHTHSHTHTHSLSHTAGVDGGMQKAFNPQNGIVQECNVRAGDSELVATTSGVFPCVRVCVYEPPCSCVFKCNLAAE